MNLMLLLFPTEKKEGSSLLVILGKTYRKHENGRTILTQRAERSNTLYDY